MYVGLESHSFSNITKIRVPRNHFFDNMKSRLQMSRDTHVNLPKLSNMSLLTVVQSTPMNNKTPPVYTRPSMTEPTKTSIEQPSSNIGNNISLRHKVVFHPKSLGRQSDTSSLVSVPRRPVRPYSV